MISAWTGLRGCGARCKRGAWVVAKAAKNDTVERIVGATVTARLRRCGGRIRWWPTDRPKDSNPCLRLTERVRPLRRTTAICHRLTAQPNRHTDQAADPRVWLLTTQPIKDNEIDPFG